MKHSCTLCQASFARPSKLTIHTRKVHLKESLFQCQVCNKDYSQAAHLKRHVENCHEKPLSKEIVKPVSFKCGVTGCTKLFSSQCGLVRHLDRHFGGQKFKCSHCAESFNTKSKLDRHTFIHTGKAPYECELCSATFFELHLYNKHKRQSHRSKVYKCAHADCDNIQFDNISAYRKHQSYVHNRYKFTCATCSRKFARKMRLEEHILSTHKTNSETFACSVDGCSKVYTLKRNLITHVKSNHLNVKYKCPHPGCPKAFVSQQKLRHHLSLHNKPKIASVKNIKKGRNPVNMITSISHEEKSLLKDLRNLKPVDSNDDSSFDLPKETTQPCDFQCCIIGCPKSFPTSFGLQVHLRHHFGEGKFKCSFCPEAFKAKSKLDRHLFIHTGKPPYECEQCPAKFFDHHSLKRHLSESHRSKIYKCKYTDCADVHFDNVFAYRRHKREIHDHNKFTCATCDQKFSQKTLLKEHIFVFHEASPETFVCSVDGCGKVFSHKRNLNTHEKSCHLNSRRKYHSKLLNKSKVVSEKNPLKGRSQADLITRFSGEEAKLLEEDRENFKTIFSNADSPLDLSLLK